jgi:phosphatidylglycerol:prolipoprotein diacylglycerol transferase
MMALFRSLFAPPRHLILLLAALWLGLLVAERRAERHNISRETLNNLVFCGLFSYLLGGRILYALENFPAFSQSPLSLLSPNLDLFDPVGALTTAILVGLVYGSRQKLPLWGSLDALAPVFAVLTIGLSLSHLAAGTAFGRPTELPWGIELWNARRHPTQIYELIASLLIFGWLWFQKTDAVAGQSFLTFAALTAGARLIIEAFRGDSAMLPGGFRLAQVIAWLVLAAILIASELRVTKKTSK